MSEYRVIEAKAWHCGAILRKLREDHQQALVWLGVNSHREIRGKFDASSFRRSWTIDGRLAAVGGVVGSVLASEGFVWLALSSEASRRPYAVAREAIRQLDEICEIKTTLRTTIIPVDGLALRFAMRLGFEPEHATPVPVGNGHVFCMIYRDQRSRQLAA